MANSSIFKGIASQFMNKIRDYLQLIRFNKPIGSLLLLWPALTALFIASGGHPSAKNVFIFTVGVFIMRSAGCILNDYLDRDFDRKVKRTADRPLAQGKISKKGALVFMLLLLVVAFILVLHTSRLTILLSLVALVLTSCYPWMKRITQWPQIWLGMTFNFGIIMAYSAANHPLDLSCWLLYLAAIIITVAYDTFYAMVDHDDDIKIGIKSTAILFGKRDRLYTALLQFFFLGLVIILGNILHLNTWYDVGLAGVVICIIYQQYLIRNRERGACFKAFLNNHYLLLFLFLGVVLSYLH